MKVPIQASGNARRLANFEGGTDNDHDIYQIYGIYRWATGQAGLRFEMDRDASTGKLQSTGTIQAPAPYGFRNGATMTPRPVFLLQRPAGFPRSMKSPPMPNGSSGPFDFEGELRYIWGKTEYDSAAKANLRAWSPTSTAPAGPCT